LFEVKFFYYGYTGLHHYAFQHVAYWERSFIMMDKMATAQQTCCKSINRYAAFSTKSYNSCAATFSAERSQSYSNHIARRVG